jgi:hypothetical protein
MHRTLLALTFTASLLTPAPSDFLGRLWDLVSEAPASTVLPKEGPGWDPDGLAARLLPQPRMALGGWDDPKRPL